MDYNLHSILHTLGYLLYANAFAFICSVIGLLILKKVVKKKTPFLKRLFKWLIGFSVFTTIIFLIGIYMVNYQIKKEDEYVRELVENQNEFTEIEADTTIRYYEIKMQFPKGGNYLFRKQTYVYMKEVDSVYNLRFALERQEKVQNIKELINKRIEYFMNTESIVGNERIELSFPELTDFEKYEKEEIVFKYINDHYENTVIYAFNGYHYTYILDIRTENIDYFSQEISDMVNSIELVSGNAGNASNELVK
jgi:hypothetical protein